MGDRQWFVLYVLVCLEVGVFLVLVPWSAIWERNYFLETYPTLRPVLLSPALRGAVCGLGVANIYVAVTEVLHRFRKTIVKDAAESTHPLGLSESPSADASVEPDPEPEPVHEES